MTLNIAFFLDSIPMSGDAIRFETSLGGSESALVFAANALAARGHRVMVFSEKMEEGFAGGKIDGVHWGPAELMRGTYRVTNFDAFISQRQIHPFHPHSPYYSTARNAYLRVLWHEDFLLNAGAMAQALACGGVDANFFVSQWHLENFAQGIPFIRKHALVTKNPVDIAWLNSFTGVEKEPFTLIHTSRPERSLEWLIPIYLRLKEIEPRFNLKVARYHSMYEPNPDMRHILQYHDRLLNNVPDVEFLGNLKKEDLYREIAAAKLMLYPANFDETGCITAVEAQALGTPMVTSNRAALQETLHDDAGYKVDGTPDSLAYQHEFVLRAMNLINDEGVYAECVEAGKKHAAQYDGASVVEEWERYILDRFERRAAKERQRIHDQLVWHDDMVTVDYMEQKHPELDKAPPRAESTPEMYADGTIEIDVDVQLPRFREALHMASQKIVRDSGRILDFACGNGAFLKNASAVFPEYYLTGIDFSEGLIQTARENLRDLTNVELVCGSLEQIEGQYDFIFCGEFLEHCKDYLGVLETFEEHLTDQGIVVITVPTGPMVEGGQPIKPAAFEGHVVHWTMDDISTVFDKKPDCAVSGYASFITPRGNTLGHFVVVYRKGGEFQPMDYEKKMLVTRPRQTLSVGMTVKNSEDWILQALKSVQQIADEIVIVHTGSTDSTLELARRFTDKIHRIPDRWPEAPSWAPDPGAFDWCKNQVFDRCTGDWFLNLDSDEKVLSPHNVHRYLHDDGFFDGYTIRQHHLMRDRQDSFDSPVRLFRNNGKYRYWGVLHEQPERVDDMNRPVFPTIHAPDWNGGGFEILHYGYVTEQDRHTRAFTRNLKLMELDRQVYPERELGELLWIREAANKAQLIKDEDPYGAAKLLNDALRAWKDSPYSKPTHRLYRVGLGEVYQKMLALLGKGRVARFQIEGGQSVEFRFDEPRFLQDYLNSIIVAPNVATFDEWSREDYEAWQREQEAAQ